MLREQIVDRSSPHSRFELSKPTIDIVNLDVTTFNAGGYHGDLNDTFCVGKVDAEGPKLVQTAFECLSAAMAMVKPGTLYRDLGTTIQKVASANKCSVVR
jgi:methionyl aminopeptidase